MEGALTYSIFYVAFLVILLSFFAIIPVNADVIKGLTAEQIASITGSAATPAAPDAISALFWPLIGVFQFISNLFLLLSVSSAHQFLAVLLGILTFGELMVIISIIRGN